ncbi:hypothetical protein GcM3_109024 [Golovinomyces cichoracearum]|uniref:Uncharacterized protein n=1 Tax=Golovinomyces cichoracearum TaxID=62708 RepID=A0A420I974_9PEZI|nr:hypothetical protein GcM3_109024 [Golovinomyces cichoracearum]
MDKCENSIINLLRNFLVKRGVYSPRERKTSKSAKLLNTIEKEDVHEWTEQEMLYQIKHGGVFSPNFDSWYGEFSSESRKVAKSSRQFLETYQGYQDKARK